MTKRKKKPTPPPEPVKWSPLAAAILTAMAKDILDQPPPPHFEKTWSPSRRAWVPVLVDGPLVATWEPTE